VLETVALKGSDFQAGYTVSLIDGGDEVAGQVTQDNCGYNFTAEKNRVARRQYHVSGSEGDIGLSNELVAYDSAQDAAKALAQWHAAAQHCPRTAVRSKVAGMPPMVEKIFDNELDVRELPLHHNAVTSMSAKVKGEGTIYNIAILQVRGRYLDAVYVLSDQPINARDSAAVIGLATVTGKRLAAVR
jgi:hypothetical protein